MPPRAARPSRYGAPGRIAAGRVSVDAGLSSQYVSALLMMAPLAEGEIEVALAGAEIGARGYVDLTLAAMRSFGAEVAQRDAATWIVRPGGYRATDFHVEPDASAATYLWAAEALTGGAIDLGVAAEAFTQPDARAKTVIDAFPAMPAVIDGSQMQDAVPTLAVLAAFNRTPVRFTGIANLRVKECDRVRALSTELDRIRPGLAHEEGDDLVVASDPGLAGQRLPARIETYADHRIAMSFALAGPAHRRHHDPRSRLRRQDLPGLLGHAGRARGRARPRLRPGRVGRDSKPCPGAMPMFFRPRCPRGRTACA